MPAEEITYDGGGQEQLGQSDIDLLAMDDASSLLLGFGKRTFGYETDSGPTSGLDTSVHVLGEKGSGMAPGDLEGDWGWVSFQLSDVSDNPDAIEYNALALSVKVDSEGSATLLDEEYLAIIQSGNTSNLFVAPESSSSQVDEVLGNLTLTDDGELGLFDGEFSGSSPLTNRLSSWQRLPRLPQTCPMTWATMNGLPAYAEAQRRCRSQT